MKKGIWVDQRLMSLSALQLPSSIFTSQVITLLFSSSGISKVKIRISKHSCSFQTLTANSLPILGHKYCSLLVSYTDNFVCDQMPSGRSSPCQHGPVMNERPAPVRPCQGHRHQEQLTAPQPRSALAHTCGGHTAACPRERHHVPAIRTQRHHRKHRCSSCSIKRCPSS